jgi:tellurite resistance protein TerC
VDVSAGLWIATVVGLLAIITLDLILVDSKPGEFGPKQATRWVAVYVTLAVAFGAFIWWEFGSQYAGEFFAGYITEYSLSVDNLFVFIVIMSSFAVPREQQHKVLLVGVVIALALRAVLITVGAAAIQRFSVTFYVFGLLLIFTAVQLLREGDDDEKEVGNNGMVRLVERFVPTTREYHDGNLFTRIDGRRVATPMLLVMVAIGTTDILFALDSIPAIFGLTQEPFLVFTANAFALMGLRQLFFLVSGLLERLVYLSIGLAVILAFIGVKLILHAIHETTDLEVPEISIALSLAVIVLVLLVTTIVSLIAVRRNPALISKETVELHGEEVKHRGEHLDHLPDEHHGPPETDDPPQG